MGFARACNKIQGQITSGANSIAQRATITALEASVSKIQYMVDEFHKRRDMVLDLLGNIKGFKLNNYRIFPYHRLDLSAIYKPTPKKNRKWQGTWAFSIYNVYSRQNPYFLYLDTQGSVATGGISANVKQVSIFPILPSVTYNIKF